MKAKGIGWVVCGAVAALLAGCGPPTVRAGAGGGDGQAQVLTAKNFQSETARGVVLVDFWATWCGPCKLQAPVIDKVAGAFKGKARVAKLDVDGADAIARKLKIEGIPTLVLFKDGKEIKRMVGLTSEEDITAALNAALK